MPSKEHPKQRTLKKRGVFSFTGQIIKRSGAGWWIDIELDDPFEDIPVIRLWGLCYDYVLSMKLQPGIRIRCKGLLNPDLKFNNKMINFRAIEEFHNAPNGKPYTHISIYIED